MAPTLLSPIRVILQMQSPRSRWHPIKLHLLVTKVRTVYLLPVFIHQRVTERIKVKKLPFYNNSTHKTKKNIFVSSRAIDITVWTVVQAVLTATFNSYGDRQISTPYKINTPEPIDKKFGTVDYVREGTLYTKFDTNSPTRGFWANGWNITKKLFFIYTFLSQ